MDNKSSSNRYTVSEDWTPFAYFIVVIVLSYIISTISGDVYGSHVLLVIIGLYYGIQKYDDDGKSFFEKIMYSGVIATLILVGIPLILAKLAGIPMVSVTLVLILKKVIEFFTIYFICALIGGVLRKEKILKFRS